MAPTWLFLRARSRFCLVVLVDFHDMKKDRHGISAENVYFLIGVDQVTFPVLLHSESYLLLLLFITCPLAVCHHLF